MRDQSDGAVDRWLRLMALWGFSGNLSAHGLLVQHYREKTRHYHTMEHVVDCLDQLDRCAELLDAPHEVALALWFHDAIYRPLGSDNERRSADWATEFLSANAADDAAMRRVHRLIMATEHDRPGQTGDESYLVDIDLSILGATAERYARFERDIRSEYRQVPGEVYRQKRAEILRRFLDRPRIYRNTVFFDLYEGPARDNLARALEALSRERPL